VKRTAIALFAAACCAAGIASAAGTPPNALPSTIDPQIMQIDEPRFLGARLRGDTRLLDEAGRPFTLGEWLGKPVILLLSYYGCDGTCPTMSANLAGALKQVTRFRPGADYRVLTVSFDRRDTPQTAADFLGKHGAVPEAMRDGWRHAVLRAQDETTDAADAFAKSVGFRFFWSDADKMFLHPNVLIFLTPEGRVARYIYGTRMDARTVELALIDADWNRISNSVAVFDILTGACYSYNYAKGRYQPNYSLLIGAGSWLLGVALMVGGGWAYRRWSASGT
jgi:protein SCO1/2